MSRVFRGLLLALVALIMVASPVLAYLYRNQVGITEGGSTDYAMLPVSWIVDNQWMADNGFMEADALDTRVQTLGGSNRPHLVASDRTLAATPVGAGTQTNLYFTTGEADLVPASMPIIAGWDGYVTLTNIPEPANNFLFEMEAYTDISQATNPALMRRLQSFGIGITQSDTIWSWVWAANGIANNGAGANNSLVWGNTWLGQTFTTGAKVAVTRISITLAAGAGAPVGDFTVSVRATAAGIPTGVDLASQTVNANTLGVGANTFDLEYPLAAATMYAIVVRHPTGDAGNFWNMVFSNAAPYGGGTYISCPDGDVTWATTPAFDFIFVVAGTSWFVESVAVTANEHIVAVEANPGANTFGITIDGGVPVTIVLGAATVPNSGNDWILNLNNAVPYINYYEHTVAGALVADYEPVSMIIGTTLPDKHGGDQNGVITWGTNPTGVSVTVGGMTSSGQPVIGSEVDTSTLDLLPVAGGSDWRPTPTVSAALTANPMRPLVTAVSDNTTLSEYQVWVWFGGIFVVIIFAITASSVRGHHLITGIATSAAIVLMVVWTVFPIWVLPIVILAIWRGLVSERSPSL